LRNDTCPQASFLKYHRIVARELALPQSEMMVCAMSLGYADPAAPENRLVTERAEVAEFARFLGFDDAADAPSPP
jgi:nitroreductase